MVSKLQYIAILPACITQTFALLVESGSGSGLGPAGIICATANETSKWTEAQINDALSNSADHGPLPGLSDQWGGKTYQGSGAHNINPLPPPALITLNPKCTLYYNSPLYYTELTTPSGFDAVIFTPGSNGVVYCAVLTNSDTPSLGWHQCNAGSN